MNTPVYKKKPFGIFVMIILIVAGSFAGCFLSLNSMYSDVAEIYYNGEDGDGICVRNDLIKRAECGINMTTLADRYPDSVSPDAVKKLSSAASELKALASSNDSRALAEINEADDELAYSIENVYNMMEYNDEISEQDKRLSNELFAEFESRGNTIRNDPYNTKALKYNKKTSGAMAEFVKKFTPAKDAVILN